MGSEVPAVGCTGRPWETGDPRCIRRAGWLQCRSLPRPSLQQHSQLAHSACRSLPRPSLQQHSQLAHSACPWRLKVLTTPRVFRYRERALISWEKRATASEVNSCVSPGPPADRPFVSSARFAIQRAPKKWQRDRRSHVRHARLFGPWLVWWRGMGCHCWQAPHSWVAWRTPRA